MGMQYEYKELMTEAQIEHLLPLCKLQHAHAYGHLVYNEDAVRATFKTVLNDTDRIYFNTYICYRNGEAIGYVLCSRNKYYFNEGFFGHLDMWFVDQKFRGTRAAIELIRKYEDWARALGCVEIWTSVGIPNINEAKVTIDILQKYDYEPYGAVLTKRVIK